MKLRFRSFSMLAVLLFTLARLDAVIIYSGPQNIVVNRDDYRVSSPALYPDGDALNLDLTGDGAFDFSFFTHAPVPAAPSFVLIGARGLNGGFYEGSSSSVLRTYSLGDLIGDGPQWNLGDGPLPSEGQLWWPEHFFGYLGGPEGYLAFKVVTGDSTNFGWIGISFEGDANASLVIRDWAFETSSGVAIAAGSTGATQPVPDEHTSIAGVSLALFAAALAGRRLRPARHLRTGD